MLPTYDGNRLKTGDFLCMKLVTDILILSPVHFVPNIRPYIDVAVRTYLEKFIFVYLKFVSEVFIYTGRKFTNPNQIRNNPVLKAITFGNAPIFPLLYRISLNYQLIGIRKIEYILQKRLSVSDSPSSGE